MINNDFKLTVDDLIVEYAVYKVKNGYNPWFKTSEFMDFLSFFQTKMDVLDVLNDKEELFNRFFDRKCRYDWYVTDNITGIKISKPHMDVILDNNTNDHTIIANYKLSDYDLSIINTYFMDDGLSKYDDYKGSTFQIRNLIKEYLSNHPKRVIDESINVDNNCLLIGKYIAVEMVTSIWDEYIDLFINENKWPMQCTDISKYLIDVDLAKIINVKSIKKELFELYKVLSKRIAILYSQDKNLKISTFKNSYLERANYDLLIKDYEKIVGIAYGKYKKSFELDLSKSTIEEKDKVSDIFDWYVDSDVKSSLKSLNDNDIKKLVRKIDMNI